MAAPKPPAAKKAAPSKKAPAAKKAPGKSATILKDLTAQNATHREARTQKAARGKRGGEGRPPVKAGKSTISHAGDPQTGGEAEPAPANLDMSKLPMRWQIFIEEYLVDMNATQAAIRSGYTPSDANNRGYLLVRNPQIAPILQARLDERLEAIRMTRERVLDSFADMAEADSNELSELRRVCCRHCYGEVDKKTQARAYQFTPAEFARKSEQWDKPDIGEFKVKPGNWYDKRKPIDETCPECFGDGLPEVVLKDTRNISRRARSIFGGVKEGKDGVEIKMYSREAALGVLAKHHKLYDETPQVNVAIASTAELDAIYVQAMEKLKADGEQMKSRMDRISGEVKS
jgi:phage terminase small subunit